MVNNRYFLIYVWSFIYLFIRVELFCVILVSKVIKGSKPLDSRESRKIDVPRMSTKKVLFLISQSVKTQKNKSWVKVTPRANQCCFLGVQDVENSKPVFDPDFHTELIIKDEYEDCN